MADKICVIDSYLGDKTEADRYVPMQQDVHSEGTRLEPCLVVPLMRTKLGFVIIEPMIPLIGEMRSTVREPKLELILRST